MSHIKGAKKHYVVTDADGDVWTDWLYLYEVIYYRIIGCTVEKI